MICVKFAAFCDLRADLQIRLATHRKSVRKSWFCKLALTWVDLRVRLVSGSTAAKTAAILEICQSHDLLSQHVCRIVS